jgi:hypothetical protein
VNLCRATVAGSAAARHEGMDAQAVP